MIAGSTKKPSIEEWMQLGEVIVERMTECVHVYKMPLQSGVFMSEAERQRKSDHIIKMLRAFHASLDSAGGIAPSVRGITGERENSIHNLAHLCEELLKCMPWISSDMQKLLKSPWLSHFPNKVAEVLFFGDGDENNGIGSGCIEHGRLPLAVSEILDRERLGEVREEAEDTALTGPKRHDVEGSARWAEQNSRFLRTAGRVE